MYSLQLPPYRIPTGSLGPPWKAPAPARRPSPSSFLLRGLMTAPSTCPFKPRDGVGSQLYCLPKFCPHLYKQSFVKVLGLPTLTAPPPFPIRTLIDAQDESQPRRKEMKENKQDDGMESSWWEEVSLDRGVREGFIGNGDT